MKKSAINLFFITALLALLSGCSTLVNPTLKYDSVVVGSEDKKMHFSVYTPPGWKATEKLPLVLFLHGGGDSHQSFEKFGAHLVLDEEINNGNLPRFILVSPNGGFSFWENWADGKNNYRDWVIDSVMPKVKSEYNTLDCPRHCHLLGISMGGFGALRFAIFEENTFSSVSTMSAAIISDEQNERAKNSMLLNLLIPIKKIFGEDFAEKHEKENLFVTWPAKPHLRKVRLQLIWGDKDKPRIRRANQEFHKALKTAGIEHSVYKYQGNHKWVSWKPQLSRAINFLLENQSNQN